MATIKSYSDLQQSRKLAEILPLESADMKYGYIAPYDYSDRMYDGGYDKVPYPKDFLKLCADFCEKDIYDDSLPCWSLSALLGVLPKIINNETLFIETSAALWHIGYRNIHTTRADNPIDACVAMIIKLKELNLL